MYEDEEDEEPAAEPFGEAEPEPEPPSRAAARARARARGPTEEPALTPQGHRRSAVTESDEIDYRMPKQSFLKRSNGAQKVDTKGIERAGAQLVETLTHFNVEARVIGTVTGPHVTRYELGSRPASRCRRSPS